MRSHRETTLLSAVVVSLAFIAAALAITNSAHARPLVLEELAKLTLPDSSYSCCGRVAIGENIIVVTASRPGPPEEGPSSVTQAAFVFERNAAGQWQYVTKLVEETQSRIAHVTPISVAVHGAFAAVALGRVYVFLRTPFDGWVRFDSTAHAGNSTDIEANSGRFLVSDGGCSYDARLIEMLATGFGVVQNFTGAIREDGCDDEFYGGDVDISADRVVVGGPEVYVFTQMFEGWDRQLIPPTAAPTGFGDHVSNAGSVVLASAPQSQGGPYLFLPPYQQHSGNLTRPDALNAGPFGRMELWVGLAGVSSYLDPSRGLDAGSIAIFSTSDYRNFTYSAKLVTSEALPNALGSDIEIYDDRSVVASANGAAYVFQVPEDLSQPAVLTDNFEDGNASDWTPIAGSGFTVVSNGSTFVYRQSSLAGAAASSPTGMNWRNQSIQTDVRPTAFDGADRWFGLTLRQSDVGNYYYVTMRSTNSVQIKKLVNGAVTTLASASFPVALGRTYNLRLEAIGTWLRAFVDGREVLRVRDTSHQSGRAGLYTFKTRADFDNVVATPSPQTTLFKDDFDSRGILDPFWQPQTGSWALANDSSVVFAQTSIAGGARAVVGIPTEDQILQARAKPTSFTTTGERWFGLITRFVDDRNYYYVTARNNNTISLRKLVNGTVTVLDSAPLQVTSGTWYNLRMEAIGNSHRLYVNGRLILEATDSSHARGIYGLASFKTAVRYDDVSVREP
jgi:hypothetical protein